MDWKKMCKVPQAAPGHGAMPAHVAARHVSKTPLDMVQRMASQGIKTVSSFPALDAFKFAQGGVGSRLAANAKLFSADTFCSYGFTASKSAAKKLLAAYPDAIQWTIDILAEFNVDFFITKDVVYIQGAKTLPRQDALHHLGIDRLCDASSSAKWPGVKSAIKYDIVTIKNQEMVVKAPGKLAKTISYGLLIMSLVVDTAYFVIAYAAAENKLDPCIDYGIQISATLGGFAAANAIAVYTSATLGYGKLVSSLASGGVGFVITGVAIGAKFLVPLTLQWARGPRTVYHFSLVAEDMIEMYTEDDVFDETSSVCDVDVLTDQCLEFNEADMYTQDDYF
ncbi:hypothetical protein SPRG_17093 [Saprolegnia parasitica CBS 223.65]|uniref:Uncharacterized protein n=1 Tax=Saprolegnia parasitica (strain CBS 223.65) TaxID=695850 RepID=A0A067BS36_SAPPC|nr:hypothetical protein SPRG_17093 [Saprolegnia parasitica CBS 223.65]KDO17487.1 hypothetical protein SPRG_17093 [Saprolegnia parasitica CBS 223.65]|eukprot:XP_012211804.1 hypothetical protein SPRG_17093 [Saprolegnia parasitica CBS 223.65]